MRPPVPRIAAVHDLSGFGRTSLSVVIPICSAMGMQVCSLPTAVLSTETGAFENFRFVDLTDAMPGFLKHWQELGLRFDAVYSGFLGSPRQASIVMECIETCLLPDGLAVVDPVMGDNGKLDATMSMEMVENMRLLITKAGCITPNLTEAALLLGEPYPHAAEREGMEIAVVKEWLRRLTDKGPDAAVITSVPMRRAGSDQTTDRTADDEACAGRAGRSAVIAYQKSADRFWKVDCDYIPAFYPGTGDTFTSVLTGSLVQGDSLPVAVYRAVRFVSLGIRAAFGHNLPPREGILLERILESLHAPLTCADYELLEGDRP